MKVLVTGANGFLGRHVVAALTSAGHGVRALVRPSAEIDALGWREGVEVVRADLRDAAALEPVFEGVDALVHLAASMSGRDVTRFEETVSTTEALYAAMSRTQVRRIVLCSSFSVYDWARAFGTVDEDLPLLPAQQIGPHGGYAAAKLSQELLSRRMSALNGWQLSILRPGFIWGRGNECPKGSMGPRSGCIQFVLCPARRPPLVHVVNAADCFRAVLEDEASIGETLNLVDDYALTAWRFMGETLRRSGGRGFRVGLPYWLLWPLVLAIHRVAGLVPGASARLPGLFVPARFAQGYRPLRFSTRRLVEHLAWSPLLTLDQTFPADPVPITRSPT